MLQPIGICFLSSDLGCPMVLSTIASCRYGTFRNSAHPLQFVLLTNSGRAGYQNNRCILSSPSKNTWAKQAERETQHDLVVIGYCGRRRRIRPAFGTYSMYISICLPPRFSFLLADSLSRLRIHTLILSPIKTSRLYRVHTTTSSPLGLQIKTCIDKQCHIG